MKVALSTWSFNEPQHDNTNKMTCAPSKDSDQPGRPPRLISVFAVRMRKTCVLSYPLSAQRRLISFGRMYRQIWVYAGRTCRLLLLSCRVSFWVVYNKEYVWLFEKRWLFIRHSNGSDTDSTIPCTLFCIRTLLEMERLENNSGSSRIMTHVVGYSCPVWKLDSEKIAGLMAVQMLTKRINCMH